MGLAAFRRSRVPSMMDVSSATEVARSSPSMPSLGIANQPEGASAPALSRCGRLLRFRRGAEGRLLDRWRLGFGQSSSHRLARVLRIFALHVFRRFRFPDLLWSPLAFAAR